MRKNTAKKYIDFLWDSFPVQRNIINKFTQDTCNELSAPLTTKEINTDY